MVDQPLISVIIPCYNAEKYVEESVRSIIHQTYDNLEIIVINDCSTDKTGSILKNLAKEDSRINYIENIENLKLPRTLNKGIGLAKGEYIARMDADDIAISNRIEKQMNFLYSNPDIDLIGSNVQSIDSQGKKLHYRSYMPLTHEAITNGLYWKSTLMHPSILAKKSFFKDLDGYNIIPYAEDYDLWIRGFLTGKKFHNLEDVLLLYRSHDKQMTDNRFNEKHAKQIRGFLLEYLIKYNKPMFLFGIFVQTRIAYSIIHKTASLRQRFKG